MCLTKLEFFFGGGIFLILADTYVHMCINACVIPCVRPVRVEKCNVEPSACVATVAMAIRPGWKGVTEAVHKQEDDLLVPNMLLR